ncbi:glycosyltransferase family 2 protein [Kaarinaea lacus]
MPDNSRKTASYTESGAMDSFRVSVVIPTFNRVDRLEMTLQSVLNQTFTPLEIIVVDDGSSDGTEAMLMARFGNSIHYHYQENRGVSHARNVGVELSSGNWIAFLDSDDQWLPEKLQLQVAAVQSNPGYGFCHTNEIWIRNGTRVNPMNKHDKTGGHIYQKCLPLCVISPSSVLIKKQVFEDIGNFDESLPVCEDYDYWLRYCASYPVLYIDSPQLIKHGGHEDQLSRRYWGMDRFRIQALLKILGSHNLSEQDRIATVDMVEEKHRILETGARKHGNTEILHFCDTAMQQLRSILNKPAQPETVVGATVQYSKT